MNSQLGVNLKRYMMFTDIEVLQYLLQNHIDETALSAVMGVLILCDCSNQDMKRHHPYMQQMEQEGALFEPQ